MSTLLAIDAGNSNIVLGFYREDKLLHQWRIYTDRKKLVDEYAELLDSLLAKHGYTLKDVEAVAISCVVPALCPLLEDLSKCHFSVEPFFVSYKNKMNLDIAIECKEEIGADLIAAGVSSVEKYGVPSVVIDFGTATTITAIDNRRRFLGGSISPGFAISTEALYKQASHLPRVRYEYPQIAMGRDTITALQVGMVKGYAHMISGLVRDMKGILGEDAKVVATGGLSHIFKKSGFIDVVDKNLVLDGIKILYEMNKSGG